jgi:hypothetical protein
MKNQRKGMKGAQHSKVAQLSQGFIFVGTLFHRFWILDKNSSHKSSLPKVLARREAHSRFCLTPQNEESCFVPFRIWYPENMAR